MTPERIRPGISACLIEEPVRFDGGHKRDPFLVESLGQFVDAVCPIWRIRCICGHTRSS
jgi:uncharacterized protein YbbK (DUF523 family)